MAAVTAQATGVVVGLSNTNLLINYQLLQSGVPVGSPLAGTGGAISFGLQTVVGTYTVVATNSITGCTNNMTGSRDSNDQPAPDRLYGNRWWQLLCRWCRRSCNAHTSDALINYQLFNGSIAVGGTAAGTGTALDFGIFTAAGTYTVTATNSVTGCTSNMGGSATIIINPLPSVYTVTGGGSYCAGGSRCCGRPKRV